MSSLMDSELQQGLAELESDQSDDGTPPQVTIGNYVWPCVKGTKKAGQVQVIGGYTLTYDFSVRVRKNAIASDGQTIFSTTTLPEPEQYPITIDGVNYRLGDIDEAQGAFVALFLVDPARQ